MCSSHLCKLAIAAKVTFSFKNNKKFVMPLMKLGKSEKELVEQEVSTLH